MPEGIVLFGVPDGRMLVLGEVALEREKQELRYGSHTDDGHDAPRWASILAKHMGRVAEAGIDADPVAYRRALLRVAAVAVAAVESLDRAAAVDALLGEAP